MAESFLYLLICLIVLLLLVVVCWYKYAYAPYQLFKRVGIPHPPVTPFFGNALEILKEDTTVMTMEKWVKKYGKVCGYYIGSSPIAIIADLDIVKEIMVKQFDKFVDAQKEPIFSIHVRKVIDCNPGLLFEKGEKWRRIRRIVSPTFSSKKLRLMIPLVEKSCVSLVERLEQISNSRHSAELHSLFAEFTMETALAASFGSEVSILKGEGNSLTEAAKAVFVEYSDRAFVWNDVFSSQFPTLVKGLSMIVGLLPIFKPYKFLIKLAQDIIQARRVQIANGQVTRNDFLQLLVNARVEDDDTISEKTLTDKEIIGLCFDFLLAGYETTSNLLAYTSYLLALNPNKQDLLCEAIDNYYQENEDTTLYDAAHNIPYLEWVIQESLRLYPPSAITVRTCTKTCIINGVTFNKGNEVVFPIQYNHHSSKYWDQPEVFEPNRFSPEGKEGRNPLCHLPFGWGPRGCIGIRFALMQAKMALLSAMKKYRFQKALDTQVPLKVKNGITQSPRDGVFLIVIERTKYC